MCDTYDTDFQSDSSSDSDYVPPNTMSKKTTVNTIDKICTLVNRINKLKIELSTVTNDKDKLEDKLRLTILELNTKMIENKALENEYKKNLENNKELRERVLYVRSRALYRKNQVYFLVGCLILSVLENIFNGFIIYLYRIFLFPIIQLCLYNGNYLNTSIVINMLILFVIIYIYINKK